MSKTLHLVCVVTISGSNEDDGMTMVYGMSKGVLVGVLREPSLYWTPGADRRRSEEWSLGTNHIHDL